MKKAMIIFMALTTFAITAQNTTSDKKQARKEIKENYTPEQRAELHTKKMTLALDLNESQQKRVKQVFLENAKSKQARAENAKEMTDQQKFDAKNAMLDRRIAMKKQMKEILTEEQLVKWEKSHHNKRGHSRKKGNLEKNRG